MKTLLAISAIALLTGAVNAQGVITRISDDGHHFYYGADLVDVFNDISSLGHDTIVLPGGQIAASADLFINWPVVVIGSGICQDSSLAYGGKTEIIGTYQRNLHIMENADGTELHGVTFRDDVWATVMFGSSIATSGADNVRFVRCEIPDLFLGFNYQGSNAHNAVVQECVIRALNVCQGHEPLVRNSFIADVSYCPAASNATFENCIFTNYAFGAGDAADYLNCIILRNQATAFTVNQLSSTFSNNLFVGTASGFSVNFAVGVAQTNTYTTTTISTGANRAFQSGVTSFTDYQLGTGVDYHSGPAWATSGSDGTQLGIFGGANPWKVGSIPFNPHWRLLTTAGSTNNGQLGGVTIKASAQQP